MLDIDRAEGMQHRHSIPRKECDPIHNHCVYDISCRTHLLNIQHSFLELAGFEHTDEGMNMHLLELILSQAPMQVTYTGIAHQALNPLERW